jgi:hypothetical protein
VISADGSRVFFNSGQPLLPSDTNGWLDVYEWERDGAGSCHQAQGCLYLLSDGTDPESSYLIGASASGNDVFILTRGRLVTQDLNGNMDVYDARVNGVTVAQEVPPCEGEACRGPVPSVPAPKSPGSSTFEAPEPPPPNRCKKGTVKKRGKCVAKKQHKAKKHHKSNKRANANRGGQR